MCQTAIKLHSNEVVMRYQLSSYAQMTRKSADKHKFVTLFRRLGLEMMENSPDLIINCHL